MGKKLKAKAVNDERAKQFVDVVVRFLGIDGGKAEVDEGAVRFTAQVGQRAFDVKCWFEVKTSQAHIATHLPNVYPPKMRNEVAEFMRPILAVPTSVGGRLALGPNGDVVWTSFCQMRPTDSIDLSLPTELFAVGIRESNRLVDQISAFVAGRSLVGSTEDPDWLKPFMNGSLPRKESLN